MSVWWRNPSRQRLRPQTWLREPRIARNGHYRELKKSSGSRRAGRTEKEIKPGKYKLLLLSKFWKQKFPVEFKYFISSSFEHVLITMLLYIIPLEVDHWSLSDVKYRTTKQGDISGHKCSKSTWLLWPPGWITCITNM